jgi:Spy/CpxP family protein refolding chaperone
MTRSNVVAVISFAVVFAAGFLVGQLGWGSAGRPMRAGVGSLTSQLDLTPPQQEAVRRIWSNQLSATTAEAARRWKQAEDERDAAVRKLLTPGQLPEYSKIVARHQERAKEFRADLIHSQSDAENRTRELLSPTQRDRFEKLIEERRADSARASGPPAGVPVSDVHDVAPATIPEDAQAR